MIHPSPTNQASEYVVDSFDGLDNNFTEIHILNQKGPTIIARAKRYGRWWILKGIAPQSSSDNAARIRLRKEFETMMLFSHPAVVATAAFETVPTLGPSIVMEYIDGITLTEWLDSPHSVKEKRKIALQLVDAIAYVHSLCSVHRDLKPDNIMITRNGNQLKIIDFGLADTDNSAILKSPAGTPGYISPEQALSSRPDVKNDIFSIGVILNQLDCGYKRIAHKCLLPAAKRFDDATALRDAIRRADRMPRYALGAALISALIIFSIFFNIKSIENKNQIDALTSTNLTLNNKIASLDDSIARLSIVNERLRTDLDSSEVVIRQYLDYRHQQEVYAQSIDQAIAEGQQILENAWNHTEFRQNFQKRPDGQYLIDDRTEKILYLQNTAQKYTDSLNNRFNTSDVMAINLKLLLWITDFVKTRE